MYKISIQSGYVQVERPDDFKIIMEELDAFHSDMAAACKESGYNKVLILGEKVEVKLSFTEIFKVGEAIAKLDLKIAVVEDHDAPRDHTKFLEDVTVNRGSQIRFFNNASDAKDWLGVSP